MATCPTCRTQYPDDVKTCASDGTALLPDEMLATMDAELVPGQTVGEYRVEGKLGEGGFGAVYRAVHPLIGKAAAIKILHRQFSSNPQMLSRFVAEARAVNQIKNRNIIDIFSFGALEDGRQYYVMELLDGMTLDAYLKKKGRLSPEEAMPIFRGIARAIDAAHAAGIAHRDLKPENVFLIFEDDGAVFPKLLDFGIAKLLGESGVGAHKTRTGTPMGTPYYMSPEQCRGRNVDHRTDVYSFGVLVFEALTGKLLFDGEDVMEILVKHTSTQPPHPSGVCPALPSAIDAPVLAFLEKDPAKRPATLGAGLDALAAAAKDAGFDVKVSARRADEGGVSSPVVAQVRVHGGATPAEAEAQTMIGDAGKTLLAAETGAKAAGSRKTVGISAAIAVVAVIGVGAFAMRGKAQVEAPRPPQPAVTMGPQAAPSTPTPAHPAERAQVSPDPRPESPASPGPTVKPAETVEPVASEVELTIDASPKVVDVYQGSEKLGSSAAPIKVKRSDGKVKLTFKSPGFASKDIEVPASSNTVVSVSLVKAGPASPPATGGGKKPEVEF